jgi:mono/diheme cytochrome c family protein
VSCKKINLMAGGVFLASSLAWAGGDLPTKFSNQGSIANTRHNMTQRQASGGPAGAVMDSYRNDYQDVCVYCHTPESTSTPGASPVWNRTMRPTAYVTYNLLGTSSLTQAVSQPGQNSLGCLSCHDGQTAIDSVIYMPGTDRYQLSQATTQDDTFLDTWNNAVGSDAHSHLALNSAGCLACHASGAGPVGTAAADFTAAALGTDLRNDHPVGVAYPAIFGAGPDFKRPEGISGTTFFFDGNRDGVIDNGEIRLYETGGVPKVECGSCHDPHGVPSGAAGSVFKPTFLRVSNAASALCLTCHDK